MEVDIAFSRGKATREVTKEKTTRGKEPGKDPSYGKKKDPRKKDRGRSIIPREAHTKLLKKAN